MDDIIPASPEIGKADAAVEEQPAEEPDVLQGTPDEILEHMRLEHWPHHRAIKCHGCRLLHVAATFATMIPNKAEAPSTDETAFKDMFGAGR